MNIGDLHPIQTSRAIEKKRWKVHYREKHPNLLPQLKFKLLHTERNTIMRKIYEAYVINYFKPEINDKDECISVKRFLVNY